MSAEREDEDDRESVGLVRIHSHIGNRDGIIVELRRESYDRPNERDMNHLSDGKARELYDKLWDYFDGELGHFPGGETDFDGFEYNPPSPERVAESTELDELDERINRLIRISNRRHEAESETAGTPAKLEELEMEPGGICVDCGQRGPVYGPINFDGERSEDPPGDYCCRRCAIERGVREYHDHPQESERDHQ